MKGAAPAASPRPARKRQAELVDERLRRAIPAPRIELDYRNAWELLTAAILSAQSTDKTVNRVTPELFRRFPTPAALAGATQEEVEEIVRSTGFFHNKAKAIRAASAALVARFGGEVPRAIDELVELPSVARKTANVVLGSAYGIAAGIVVDRHVARVARRLGLTREDDPVRVESDLCAVVPRPRWIETGFRLQLHGRYVCTARAPRCAACPANEICPSREAKGSGDWTERAAGERRVVEAQGEVEAPLERPRRARRRGGEA